MKLVAFTGPMGSGKSTAIEALSGTIEKPKAIKLVKFAQPLYDMQEMIYRRINTVYERPVDFKKDRTLLQWLGTNWGRNTIDKDLWLKLWQVEATKWADTGITVVCDDVRFDNEADAVKKAGGIVIRLSARNCNARAQGGEGLKAHASELGVSDYLIDATIENEGTLDEFKNSILTTVNTMLGSKR